MRTQTPNLLSEQVCSSSRLCCLRCPVKRAGLYVCTSNNMMISKNRVKLLVSPCKKRRAQCWYPIRYGFWLMDEKMDAQKFLEISSCTNSSTPVFGSISSQSLSLTYPISSSSYNITLMQCPDYHGHCKGKWYIWWTIYSWHLHLQF